MAKFDDDEVSEESSFEQDDEEALSLCDLPLIVNKEENQTMNEIISQVPEKEKEEDFEFGSWGSSSLTESEICVADNIFFNGQILPLRLSISSENGFAGRRKQKCESRSISISESMEHCSSETFTGESSRSSSMSSHDSTGSKLKKTRNQFHTQPSPKPRIWVSGGRPGRIDNRSRKSTLWVFFRLGPVKTPEIEVRDLKMRKKNKSFNSNNCRKRSGNEVMKLEKKKTNQRLFGLSSCKCSVDTVSSRKAINYNEKAINGAHGKKMNGRRQIREEKSEKQKQGKQGMSHRRTFEWLKELSIADALNEAYR